MKKMIFALFLPVFCFMSQVNAQIPNGGFETWIGDDPDNWVTSNASPYISVFQSTNAHSGTYSARGEVINVVSTNVSPALQCGPGGVGIPVSQRYSALQLYYIFNPIGGDKFGVDVVFYKSGNPIAVGAVLLPVSVSAYTQLTVPVNYTTSDTPDVVIITILIDGPNSTDYHLGTIMFVDDFSFTAPSGIDQANSLFSIGESFPNPCNEFMEIPVKVNNAGMVQVKIYDAFGREVKNSEHDFFASGEFRIPVSVSDLEGGFYFFTISSNNFSSTGKFVVKK